MNEAIRMQLSAFVDDELPENEVELLVLRMSQDEELRQEIAGYLAIGRAIRSEHGIAAADRLYARVAAVLDDHEEPVARETVSVKSGVGGAMRPLFGVAVAASVALLAIFALRQAPVDDDSALPASSAVVADSVPSVVPSVDAQQERQRQYFRSHAELSSALGANSINSRVVSLRFREERVEADNEDAESTEATPGMDQP